MKHLLLIATIFTCIFLLCSWYYIVQVNRGTNKYNEATKYTLDATECTYKRDTSLRRKFLNLADSSEAEAKSILQTIPKFIRP